MTRLLFVCTRNQLRSPTAETVFSEYENVEAIGCGTNCDARLPLSGDLVDWADIILTMEKRHKIIVSKRFRRLLKGKKVVSLDIPDKYSLMDPELVRLLKAKVEKYI